MNVFGSTWVNSSKTFDTSIFLQKPYLRTTYIESNFEENIDMKYQFRIKIIPMPLDDEERLQMFYVDIEFEDSSIIRNTTDIDFTDKKVENITFVKVNYEPAVDSLLTAKIFVDNLISHSVD